MTDDFDKDLIYGFYGKFRFLSNFFPVPGCIIFDGLAYPTVEHAYHAAKSTDDEERRLIHAAETPGQAKAMSRDIKHKQSDWDELKVIHMENLLRVKFRPGTALARNLIATGNTKLVEANSWGDTFWGRCKGHGKNTLGLLLMELRTDLQQGYLTEKGN